MDSDFPGPESKTRLRRTHNRHEDEESDPLTVTTTPPTSTTNQRTSMCFICNQTITSGRIGGTDRGTLMLLLLSGYPRVLLNSFGPEKRSRDTDFPSDFLKEQLKQFELCGQCETQLGQVCHLIAQVQKLHQKIRHAQEQVQQLIQASLNEVPHPSEQSEDSLTQARYRILHDLTSPCPGSRAANEGQNVDIPEMIVVKQEYDPVETEDSSQNLEPNDFDGSPDSEEDATDFSGLDLEVSASKLKPVSVKRRRGRPSKAESLHDPAQGQFACSHCTSVFSQLNNLRAHCRTKHPGHPLPTKYDFLDEQARSSRFSCKHCPSSFKTFYALRKHYKKTHPEQPRPRPTSADFPNFPSLAAATSEKGSKKALKQLSADMPETRPRTCPYCPEVPEVFVNMTEKEYKTHLRQHTKPYKCKVEGCTAEFTTSSSLRAHCIRLHPELKIHPGYPCPHCSFVSPRPEALKDHVKSLHETHLTVPCSVPGCSFRTPNACRLTQHMERVHEGKKKFLCTECGRGYYFQAKLLIHMRSHTGEKPFECPVCKKRFTKRERMRRHTPIHGHERPFVCELCGLRFPTKNNLTGHRHSWHKGGGQRVGVQPKRKGKYNSDL